MKEWIQEDYFQKAVDVLDGDTPETLQRRIMEQAEWKLLLRQLTRLPMNMLINDY